MAWTDDRVAILSKLWAEGLSASQIATKLGGVTRNAVIGKVHRLGLSGRVKPKAKSKAKLSTSRTATSARKRAVSVKRRTAPRPAPTPPPPPLEARPLPSGEFATILTITEYLCKWPLGDPTSNDFRFCGRGTDKGEPYCKSHAQLAYQPSRRRVTTNRAITRTNRQALR